MHIYIYMCLYRERERERERHEGQGRNVGFSPGLHRSETFSQTSEMEAVDAKGLGFKSGYGTLYHPHVSIPFFFPHCITSKATTEKCL